MIKLFHTFKKQILSKPYYQKRLFLDYIEEELNNLYSNILQQASTTRHLIPFYQSLTGKVDVLEGTLKSEFDTYFDIPQIYDFATVPVDKLDPEAESLDELFFSEKYHHYFEEPDGRKSYEQHLNQKLQITFKSTEDFTQFYLAMKHSLKCLIASQSLDPLRLFLNKELVNLYAENIETIKTSLTVDQIAILANLFHRDCAPQTDKAVLQRIISSILIPKSGKSAVSLSSLTNKMKPSYFEYSDNSRKATKELIENWINSPYLKSL